MKNALLLFAIVVSLFTFSQEAELVTQQKDLGTITFIDYSSDGKLIASGSSKDNLVKVWDVRSGKVLGVLSGHQATTTTVQFIRNNNQLISSDAKGKTYIWNLNNWSLQDSIKHQVEITKITTSENTNHIAFGDKLGAVYVLEDNSKSPKKIGQIKGVVTALNYHYNKKLLVAGSKSGIMAAWNITDNKRLMNLRLFSSPVLGIEFIQDNSKLLLASLKGKLTQVNIESGKKEDEVRLNHTITAIAIHNNTVGFSSRDNIIRFYNYSNKKEISSIQNINETTGKNAKEPIRTLKFSPDGSAIAGSSFRKSGFGRIKSSENVIKLWDVKRGTHLKSMKGEVDPLETFCFHPKENRLITMSDKRQLTFWNLNTAEIVDTMTLPEPKLVKEKVTSKKVGDVAKAVGGIFSGGGINLGGLRKPASQTIKKVIKRRIKQRPILTYSANGNYFISRLTKDEIRIYKTNKTKLNYIDYAKHRQSQVNDFATDFDEKYIVCVGDGDSAISIVNLETGKLIKKLKTEYLVSDMNLLLEAVSVAFNSDGSLMAVCFNNGKAVVFRSGSWSKVFENRVPAGLGIAKGAYVNFSQDGKFLIVNGNEGLKTYDLTSYIVSSTGKMASTGRPLPLNRPLDYLVAVTDKNIEFESIKNTGTVKKYPILNKKIVTSVGSDKHGMVGITFRTGEFKIFNPETGEAIVTMVGQKGNSIFKTNKNYYKVDKKGFDLVTFRVGKDAFPFEQFDAKYNRPDLVLKELKSEDEMLVSLYEKAYQKRLKKLGLKEADLKNLLALPKVNIENRTEIPLTTSDKKITVKFKATDADGMMKSYNVLHNNVPLFGRNGKPVPNSSSFDLTEEIELVNGINNIQVLVKNNNGNESLKEFIEVSATIEETSNLYVIAVGTSKYKDSRFDLNYASKDAMDLKTIYASKSDETFEKVHVKTITNEMATKENILALKAFLKDAKKSDVVMVFIAGHGVLNNNFDYFYGTHDINFEDPDTRGLVYEDLESILDGIKPLKKILIMDTCHSGEVDKDDVSISTDVPDDSGEEDITFRSVGPAVKDNQKASPTKMMKELFVDLRKGTGTTVVSSAGGVEYAMESDEWKNGLFTYCLINGLKNKTADLNSDGKIMLSELQFYLKSKVSELSHGKQVPTTRIENLNLDYRVW